MSKSIKFIGERITPQVSKVFGGQLWGVNVWDEPVTQVRRYYYLTRSQARSARFTDEVGQNGRMS